MIWKEGKPLVTPAATGMKPDMKPAVPVEFERGTQGLAKFDCVTVWFFCLKLNVTVSPGMAVIFAGE